MDRIFLPLPVGHVTGVDFSLTIPPVSGGCVVLSRMTSLEQAANEVVEYDVTTVAAKPEIIPRLAEAAQRRGGPIRIKVFVAGGTTVAPALLAPAEEMGLAPRGSTA